MMPIYAGSGIEPFMDAVETFEKGMAAKHRLMCRVIAVDPGKVTGITVLWFDPVSGEIIAWGTTLITHDEVRQVWSLMALLRQLADHGRVWIVVEGFTVAMVSMDPDFLSPVRIGSRFEMGAEIMATGELGVGPVFGSIELPVVWNSRSRKADYDDARLKKLGFYVPGPDHRRDSTRHALVRHKQLCLQLPFAVEEIHRTWQPVAVQGGEKVKVTRSFNGKPTGAHGQNGVVGVTKSDMERIKLGKDATVWDGKNVVEKDGMRWVPGPKGVGFVLEHDPRTSSGIAPAPADRLKSAPSSVKKSSPKAKKRVMKRLA